jgi:hypothetical protein
MKNFVEDLKRYDYQFLEFDIENHKFNKYNIDFENNSKSKMFNKQSPIMKNFNLLEKINSVEINTLKLKFNETYLNKKYNRDNMLDEIKQENLNFFIGKNNLYEMFLKYCDLKDEETIMIINKNSEYKHYYMDFPIFLVLKEENDFYIIHRKNTECNIEIYNINESKFVEIDYLKMVNCKKFYVFQVVNKKDLIDFDKINYSCNKKRNKKK